MTKFDDDLNSRRSKLELVLLHTPKKRLKLLTQMPATRTSKSTTRTSSNPVQRSTSASSNASSNGNGGGGGAGGGGGGKQALINKSFPSGKASLSAKKRKGKKGAKDEEVKVVKPVKRERETFEPVDDVERKHLVVGDKRWDGLYKEAKKAMGGMKPIHEQADQNRIHDILRVFDTTYAYGPCGLGMTRLERWERAQALGLSPPEGVREILLTREGTDDPSYRENVFVGEV